MLSWGDLSGIMDGIVDNGVGDDISYDQGAGFVTLKGFVVYEIAPLDLTSIDAILSSRPRVKIQKALVAEPLRSHRLQSALLGAFTFQPGGDEPQTQGRYWIFDIQKV